VRAKGLTAGALATCALLGLTYTLAQIEVVSFFPLDVAQAGIRLTPGAIASQGIEALGSGAKMLAEASALLLVLLIGAAAGGVALRFRCVRHPQRELRHPARYSPARAHRPECRALP